MEHKFEYDGVEVVMHSPTVSDRIKRRLIIGKLRTAYGIDPAKGLDSISDEFAEAVVEYADMLSMTNSPGSAWWRGAGDTPEQIREGHECYMVQEAELFDTLSNAETSVKPPKKVTANGSKK